MVTRTSWARCGELPALSEANGEGSYPAGLGSMSFFGLRPQNDICGGVILRRNATKSRRIGE
jgi:hypothetical protein